MRSFWRKLAASLCLATVFQLGGCDFGPLNDDIRAAASDGLKSMLVDISTIIVGAFVDDTF